MLPSCLTVAFHPPDDERKDHRGDKQAVADEGEPGKGGMLNVKGLGRESKVGCEGPFGQDNPEQRKAQQHQHQDAEFTEGRFHCLDFGSKYTIGFFIAQSQMRVKLCQEC